MLTLVGLNKVKKVIMKLASPTDAEVNAILQDAVKQINRLRISRHGK
jgi:uncharacterized membrane protein